VNASLKVFGNKSFALPMNLNGMVKSITIYDISGKLIQKAIVKKDNLNLQKDFGISNGLYLVHVKGEAKVTY
jgi:hypothetical protein